MDWVDECEGLSQLIEFSEDIKSRYPGPDYADLENEFQRGREQVIGCIPCRAASPVATLPVKVYAALHTALLRNLETVACLVGAFNVELYAPLFVLSRAVLETGCLAWDAWQRLAEILNSANAELLDEYDIYIKRVVLGSRSKKTGRDPDEYAAHHILSVIERLDRKNPTDIRSLYDALSEVAHPNACGLTDTYVDPRNGPDVIVYEPHPFSLRADSLSAPIDAAIIGLNLTVGAVAGLSHHFESVVELAEENLHSSGLWPEGLPYPRRGAHADSKAIHPERRRT